MLYVIVSQDQKESLKVLTAAVTEPQFLTNFFHANGEGVPIEDLHNQKYKEIWSIGFFYDQHTDHL